MRMMRLKKGLDGNMAIIANLYRYPVKGLSAEPLSAVTVAAGECLPLDRSMALARADSPFDPSHPVWLRKTRFLMLMRDERLAALDVRYDDAERRLTIRAPGGPAIEADLETAHGWAEVEAFFEEFMGEGPDGRPRLVEAARHAFTDSAKKYLSLINLATLREIEAALGRPVHPLRFRANLYVEDLPAWAEFDWVGEEIEAEGSSARLKGMARITRCAATEVDPKTAERDLAIPQALRRHFGHIECGIYLEVTQSGELAPGRTLMRA
jgi:uncharacterized protein YcbX